MQLLDENHQMKYGRLFFSFTRVNQQGMLLAAGGFERRDPTMNTGFRPTDQVELWDAEAQSFISAWANRLPVQMNIARAAHSATRLNNDVVFIGGGTDGNRLLDEIEFYCPYSTVLSEEGLN